jgi:hypothetical protein
MPPRTRTTKKTVTRNALEAEATAGLIVFTWRGVDIVADPSKMEFGRAAFALRRVGNNDIPLMTRVNALVDIVEAALGQEQLAAIVEAVPRFFDDIPTMTEFWDVFQAAMTGGTTGESSAS